MNNKIFMLKIMCSAVIKNIKFIQIKPNWASKSKIGQREHSYVRQLREMIMKNRAVRK